MSAERALRSLLCGLALCTAGAAAVAEKPVASEDEELELDFLEYLGMWEKSDEDWQIFDETTLDETTLADSEERNDPAPEGEESMEKEDES